MTLRTRRSGGGQLPAWFGVPFLLGGVLGAVVGVVLLLDELRYGSEGVSVRGVAVETIYWPGGADDGPSYSVRYEFADPATGTVQRGESDVSEGTYDSTTTGDAVEVTYLPADPTKSRLGSPEPQLFLPLIVMGMAAIFAVVGIGLLVLTARMRRHGVPAWATMTPEPVSDPAAESATTPLAAFFADDEAPRPVADQPPTSAEEIRALDARLAAPEHKP